MIIDIISKVYDGRIKLQEPFEALCVRLVVSDG